MVRTTSLSVCLTIYIGLLTSCTSSAQSVDLAKDYYQHGLNEKAKETLIVILHGTMSLLRARRPRFIYWAKSRLMKGA